LPDDAIVTEGTKSFIFVLDNSVLHDDEDENHSHEQEDLMAFRMVEIIPGSKDDGHTEVKLINSLPENSKIVLNAAYYLLADMNKEETEHEH
jgi:cobalt-zinc-cadmium efflux system membrane fusion protein